MSTAHALNPHSFPLRGSHLIEASAGTGKTWTIAALYVRLVLGHGDAGSAPVRPMLPQDVLVMTFTRAATRELSDRIVVLHNGAMVADGHPDCEGDLLSRVRAILQDFEQPLQIDNHTVDLGAGTADTLTLASGTNALTIANVETLTGGTGADTITRAPCSRTKFDSSPRKPATSTFG